MRCISRLTYKRLPTHGFSDPTSSLQKSRTLPKSPKAGHRSPGPPGYWPLQDAKARFSKLVRRVHSEGPQHVTVHGRDAVVVISAEEFHRLKGKLTGQALIAALQASPYRDIEIEPGRAPMPVRDVTL